MLKYLLWLLCWKFTKSNFKNILFFSWLTFALTYISLKAQIACRELIVYEIRFSKYFVFLWLTFALTYISLKAQIACRELKVYEIRIQNISFFYGWPLHWHTFRWKHKLLIDDHFPRQLFWTTITKNIFKIFGNATKTFFSEKLTFLYFYFLRHCIDNY